MFKSMFVLILLVSFNISASDIEKRFDFLEARLTAVDNNLPIAGFSESDIPGFTYVQLTSGQILTVSNDGEFLFSGPLYRITEDQFIDIAEQKAAVARAEYLKDNDLFDLSPITFAAEGVAKKRIFVFTDISCGFCRKLHQETVPGLQAAGVEVNYLGFPREGLAGMAKQSLDTAFCADDKQDTLTRLKRNEGVEPIACDSPVAGHYELARQLGIKSTPAILTSEGTLTLGYRPVPEMLSVLNVK